MICRFTNGLLNIISFNKNGTSRTMRCVSVDTKRHYLIKTNAAFHHIKTRHVRIGSLSKGNCHRCFFAKVNWVQGYTKRNYLVTLKRYKENIQSKIQKVTYPETWIYKYKSYDKTFIFKFFHFSITKWMILSSTQE